MARAPPQPSSLASGARRGHLFGGLAVEVLLLPFRIFFSLLQEAVAVLWRPVQGVQQQGLVANVYSTDPDGLQFVRAHREKYLKPDHTPASTWVVVSRLANPKWVMDMETVAAKGEASPHAQKP
jgi:hypothetical protein